MAFGKAARVTDASAAKSTRPCSAGNESPDCEAPLTIVPPSACKRKQSYHGASWSDTPDSSSISPGKIQTSSEALNESPIDNMRRPTALLPVLKRVESHQVTFGTVNGASSINAEDIVEAGLSRSPQEAGNRTPSSPSSLKGAQYLGETCEDTGRTKTDTSNACNIERTSSCVDLRAQVLKRKPGFRNLKEGINIDIPYATTTAIPNDTTAPKQWKSFERIPSFRPEMKPKASFKELAIKLLRPVSSFCPSRFNAYSQQAMSGCILRGSKSKREVMKIARNWEEQEERQDSAQMTTAAYQTKNAAIQPEWHWLPPQRRDFRESRSVFEFNRKGDFF